ncbi:MAG TPA: type II CAAX endopeptidase family protein [Terriglobia bacterium]|nr:type II CAAX endopeptidase family protein [Terriglobia bacterium]
MSFPFINESGELRSGWKFLVFTVIFLLLWFITAIILSVVFRLTPIPYDFLTNLALNALALFFPAIGATLFVARFVDHRPASTFIGFENWPRSLAIGLVIGATLLVVIVAATAIFGGLRIGPGGARWPVWLATAAILVLAAANEELVFRGYPLQSLARGIGEWPAAMVMSGLFGLLHVGNPHASVIGIMNTIVAGLMLSRAYFKARSIWLPYGIHVAWNTGLGIVLGFSLSGIEVESLLRSSASGSATLTGGPYGPEGGVLCAVTFLAGFAAIHALSKSETSKDHDHTVR